ncbi:hypothetical protein MMC09_004677 [Bachmanniomyces sp. S44760]|nr:hypothetical protein [Bachmanniomyces sp. S44760]
MPLSSDEQVNKTSQGLVSALQAGPGWKPGYRPAHGKGFMLNGTFTPSAEAKALSVAPHLNNASTPILARFSNSTGNFQIPDADPNSNPRGIAIRFELGPHVHTDVIAHSTPFFPTRTGAEFLEMLQAVGSSGPDVPSPKPIEKFLGTHPFALAFVQAPKPTPSSYAREMYYGVNAFKLVNEQGKETYVRYRVEPAEGVDTLDEADLKEKDPNFLHEEIAERIQKGPLVFHLKAQIAEEGDITDDATKHWPEDRKLVELGKVELKGLEAESDKEQKQIIFDPIPRVKGVEPSGDPLLEVRAAVYLISGRERRKA